MLRSSIERYRNFVLEHQRFPFITSDDEDERRLYMWRCNIRSRMRHVTGERDHELLAFDEEHRHLPHNRYEQRAHDMIKRVKDVVTQTGAMPTPQRHPDESLWLVQAAQRSEQWKDNRRAYYDDLQAFLRERGLV